MTSRVLVAAAAAMAVGVVAGCSQTVTGSVAMTTEPGYSAPRSSPVRTPAPRTSGPRTPRTPSNAPGTGQVTTCGEYGTLSPADQVAVAEEVFGLPEDMQGGFDMNVLAGLISAYCQFASPDTDVKDAVNASPP